MEPVKIIAVEPDDKSLKGTQTATSGTNCVTGIGSKSVSDTVNHRKLESPQDGSTKDMDDDSSQEYVYLYNSDTSNAAVVKENNATKTCSNNNNKLESTVNRSGGGSVDLKADDNCQGNANSDDNHLTATKAEQIILDVKEDCATVTVDVQVHHDNLLKGNNHQCIVDYNSSVTPTSDSGVIPQGSTSSKSEQNTETCSSTSSCTEPVPMSTSENASDNTCLVSKDTCDRTSITECKNESCDKSSCDNLDQQDVKPEVKPDYGGARPKLQIQPRRVQYQKHEMLQGKKDNEGLSELEAYLREREVTGRRYSKDSDVSGSHMSQADLMHKRRSLPFVPRTSQYEKHSLLQEKTESGHNEIELFLMEKENNCAAAAEKRAYFRKGYSLQEDVLLGTTNAAAAESPCLPPLPAQKLVPRGATFERHHLLKKTASGLSELEMLLLDKEREFEERRRSIDCVGGATASGYSQKLLPRTEQYEKNVLLETITGDGALLLDEVLGESAAIANQDKESLLDPNSSIRQKRGSSGSSVRRVHFDPSSVCEESDGEQRDESDRLLDHSSADSSSSTTSSAARRKKSGTGRNKLSTGLTIDKSPETSHSSVFSEPNDMTVAVKPEEPVRKGCCVVS